MKQPGRLGSGGAIDRGRSLEFSFNGRRLQGHPGDSLASALLACSVNVVGRSFKFHRPRGIFTAGEEEPCALVEIGDGPTLESPVRAPCVDLVEGLSARSLTGWPSLRFDLGRTFDYTHRLWPVGFYNKMFKWPNWKAWEGLVRGFTGLGQAPTGPDPDRYEQVNAHCDVLICGGGPAGMLAALAAGRSGMRVILADQGRSFGGVLRWERIELDGQPALTWAETVIAELESMPNVVSLPATTVAAIYDDHVTTLLQKGHGADWRECLWTVRPRTVVLAAGAIEQGLIFPDNDRPGIMLAGAVRHYLNRYAVAPGRHAIVATNNDTAYQTALDLAAKGIRVRAIVDARDPVDVGLRSLAQATGAELITGARIAATRGAHGIREVDIESLDGRRLGRRGCSLLAASGGWAPRVQLFSQARGSLRFDVDSQSFVPADPPRGLFAIGAARGTQHLGEALEEALRAAREIADGFGAKVPDLELPRVTRDVLAPGLVFNPPPARARRRQWIDLAHDVTLDDAALAVREGFDSVEHFKRFTTTGMAVDQGKTGNINAFIALGWFTGRPPSEVGTTTFRPPYTPVTLGALAGASTGEFYAPRRHLPAHAVHERLGGRFEDYGWQRPDCYVRDGEDFASAVQREVLAVRNAAGVFDNSPIGKIEVRGPDAAEFLHRVYINDVHGLAPGRARYGLMLNENGVIIDDGVFVRLDRHRFVVHTTSGGAGRITGMLEEWLQCEWRDLQVLVDDVTTQWANFTLAGPNARKVLAALGADIELSSKALPHMAAAVGRVAGLEARITRVSFSGEPSFEVNIAAGHACGFLERALETGREFGLAPYGIEALMVLRAEKGYFHVGTDTDGTTTPDDVGWGPVARRKESDFIGRRSLFRAANQAGDRRQWVGLLAEDASRPMRPGGHVLANGARRAPVPTDGWITSACYSPTLGRHIALAMVKRGRELQGQMLTVCDGGDRYQARVVSPVFFDSANERLRT